MKGIENIVLQMVGQENCVQQNHDHPKPGVSTTCRPYY